MFYKAESKEPEAKEPSHSGLSDFSFEFFVIRNDILQASKRKYKKLIEEISGLNDTVEKAVLIGLMCERFNLSPQEIRSDFSEKQTRGVSIDNLEGANFPNLLDFAENDGKRQFVLLDFNQDKDTVELSLDNFVSEDDKHFSPPSLPMSYLLPRTGQVARWFFEDDDKILFDNVIEYLKRFTNRPMSQLLIIAANIFVSYIEDHPDINNLSTVLFYGPPNTGKSQTGNAAINISYRGISCMSFDDNKIFYYINNLMSAIFFDVDELWEKSVEAGFPDVLLGRHKKGAYVNRTLSNDGKPVVQQLNIFGATFAATQKAVEPAFMKNCIILKAPEAPGIYETPEPLSGLQLKERITSWRGRMICAETRLPDVEKPREVSESFWSLIKPLIQIIQLISPVYMDYLTNELSALENDKKQINEQDE